jgi:flagellar biogenesis protein FliO
VRFCKEKKVMLQEIIVLILFLLAVVYLYKKLAPKRAKKLAAGAVEKTNCGCGSSCPLGKK